MLHITHVRFDNEAQTNAMIKLLGLQYMSKYIVVLLWIGERRFCYC